MVIHGVSGKVVIEPKAGKSYESVLLEAIDAVRVEQAKAT